MAIIVLRKAAYAAFFLIVNLEAAVLKHETSLAQLKEFDLFF